MYPVGRRGWRGDFYEEGAARDRGDDEVGRVALVAQAKRYAFAGPAVDLRIEVEETCEVAGRLRHGEGRDGAHPGGDIERARSGSLDEFRRCDHIGKCLRYLVIGERLKSTERWRITERYQAR